MWESAKNNPISTAVAYDYLGYKSRGGYAARIIAALKQFDLIYVKQDAIKLTNEAVDLALHRPSDDRYIEIVKKLALKPAIYENIFNRHNGILPSDNALTIELIKEYEFNPESVEDFIGSFRKTIEFAGLSGSRKTEKEEQDKLLFKMEDRNIMSGDSSSGLQSSLKKPTIEMPIPVSPTELVVMKIPYPLSEEGWKQLLTILPMYKPGLVVQPIQAKDETKES